MITNNPSRAQVWTGRILGGLLVAFLVLDAGMKLLKSAPVLDACPALGIPEGAIVGIGATLLACTILYMIPRTAILGAILLTGYLGGAVFTHVRSGQPAFNVGFAVGFGVLVWLSLGLRDRRVRALVSARAEHHGNP